MFVHIAAIHRDERFHRNPTEFYPERFFEEGGRKKMAADGTLLTFGGGPRVCLGYRFALLEMKMCLVEVLRHFKLSVRERSQKVEPSEFHFYGYPSTKIPLTVEKI